MINKINNTMIKIEKYSADWCQPCKTLNPIIKNVVHKYKDKVEFVEIDINEDPIKSAKNEIRSVPTVIIYDADGEEYARVIGANPKKEYVDIIESVLN